MRYLAIVLVTLSLASCVTTQNHYPRNVQASGPYKQELSGITFPDQVHGFNRVSITAFDPKAKDIGVGYNHNAKKIALTLYSYPAPKVMSFGSPQHVIDEAKRNLFIGAYERSKQDILNAHPNGDLVSESRFAFQQNARKYSGLHSSFRYHQNHAGTYQEVLSHLYLFQVDELLLKYRVTYPAYAEAEKEVIEFMNALSLSSDGN